MTQPPASFLPSRDGFPFSNSWPSAPAVVVRSPFGDIGIGNAAGGLCGGMVFAALDYWHARSVPPPSRPAAGSPLFQFIVRRLIDSWEVPAGVARYYQWMNLPDADRQVRVAGRPVADVRGVSRRTIEQHWPQVRASIDDGQPAPLGLVTVASANPGLLSRNHQVLAYGYQLTGTHVALAVYDPNSGPDDGVHIMFDSARAGAVSLGHNINIRRPVRGFFLTSSYAPVTPPGVRLLR